MKTDRLVVSNVNSVVAPLLVVVISTLLLITACINSALAVPAPGTYTPTVPPEMTTTDLPTEDDLKDRIIWAKILNGNGYGDIYTVTNCTVKDDSIDIADGNGTVSTIVLGYAITLTWTAKNETKDGRTVLAQGIYKADVSNLIIPKIEGLATRQVVFSTPQPELPLPLLSLVSAGMASWTVFRGRTRSCEKSVDGTS